MYNAKIDIEVIDNHTIRVVDLSEGEEIIIGRIVSIRTAKGCENTYTFDLLENEMIIEDYDSDIALQVEFVATPEEESETSTYTDCIVFPFVPRMENYILSLNAKLYCDRKCNNKDLAKGLDISYNYDGMLMFAECGDLYKTQRMIDYIQDYMEEDGHSCCNSSKCKSC